MAEISEALAFALHYFSSGQLDAADQVYRRVLAADPRQADALHMLGVIAMQRGQHAAAAERIRQAIGMNAENPIYHSNLGNALSGLGHLDEAIDCYRRAVTLKPDFAEALSNLGSELRRRGEIHAAAVYHRRAIAISPGNPVMLLNLANTLRDLGQLEEAISSYRSAVHLEPGLAAAYCGLGKVLATQGKADEAIECYRTALNLNPDQSDACNDLGALLQRSGDLEEAQKQFRRALALNREAPTVPHSNLLLTMQYSPDVALPDLARAHAEFERLHAAPLRSLWHVHANRLDPERRLRVGFVSPDFARHPVGLFLAHVAEQLKHGSVDTFFYSDRETADEVTARLRLAAGLWRETNRLNDDQLAARIREDQIDLLFDLAGHTAKNRLLLFARKPAPLQITWLGYVGTTGLSAIDYILADPHEIPPAAEPHYAEKVLRMPDGYVCFEPPADAPAVSPLPALKNGYVTFGSFNNPAKITSQVIEIWSRVLQRVPGSRLVLKYRGMGETSIQERLQGGFAERDIDPRRVEFLGWSPNRELLAEYRRIDVALDTFPYNGGLTTCEALWMGVPFITCPGETFASRHSLSHLSNAGLPEMIAGTLDDYVELAVAWANDLRLLANVRARLRRQLASSPLCDAKRFAANLERLLRGCWRNWCERTPSERLPPGTQTLTPESAEALANLGLALKGAGRLDEAADALRRALALKPDIAVVHYNLGNVLELLGKQNEAGDCFRRAVELKPDFPEAENNLGTILESQGDFVAAEGCYRRAIAHRPDYAGAHNNLGNALRAQGKLTEAEACHRRALQLKADFAEALNSLGLVLNDWGKSQEAEACLRQAAELQPNSAVIQNNLALALKELERSSEAVECFRKSIELNPKYGIAHNNLGTMYRERGELEEAVACYRSAMQIEPEHAGFHSNLLQVLAYRADVTASELLAEHREYERRHAAALREQWQPHENNRDPERALRVGFVSPDYGRHPVGYFLAAVLERLDKDKLQTFLYSDRLVKDRFSERFQAAATKWRDVMGWRDERLAEQIRVDQIDILLDLAGHTARNRLLVFARKPAPLQVTWLGYVGTTGLEAMDYILADKYEVPPELEAHYVEKVLRMPHGYVCYEPPANTPDVNGLPALANRYVTFGSFNNPAKITAPVTELWAQILKRVPGSRLVLKYKGLAESSFQQRLHGEFAKHDIDPQRIECLGWSPHQQLLAAYGRIDLALDTFPYSGGLTTCEALWMGVPVITWPGETFASRHSLSHLSNAGLTETIAATSDQYVELAVAWATDFQRLAKVRQRLREQMAASPLCDSKRFAPNFTKILRRIWRSWCKRK